MIAIEGMQFKDPVELHNKHIGEHCIIIGGGETIRDWQKSGLNVAKMIQCNATFGINRSYRLGVSTYHTCMDWSYWSSEKDQLSKLDTVFMLPQSVCVNGKLTNAYMLRNCGIVEDIIPHNFNNGINYGKSSGYIAMVCAYLMGYNPIYLLGFDLVGHHFHEGYGKDRDMRINSDHRIIYSSMVRGIKELQKRNISIISLSLLSRLNQFIEYDDHILQPYIQKTA